jgi:hypothetical protein
MTTLIETPAVSESATRRDALSIPSSGAGYALTLTLLYQDAQTRKWAREVHERVASLAGTEAIRATWWKMSNLSEPGVLAGAVSTAMQADVIVVSVNANEGLPLPFYVWVNAWLPHRLQVTGALVALLGMPQQTSPQCIIVREHLRAVAKQSRMDFLLDERKLVVESPRPLRDEELVVIGRAGLAQRAAISRT